MSCNTCFDSDLEVVDQFKNFLSWGVTPTGRNDDRHVPPAWFAYALGLTQYCPPEGEL